MMRLVAAVGITATGAFVSGMGFIVGEVTNSVTLGTVISLAPIVPVGIAVWKVRGWLADDRASNKEARDKLENRLNEHDLVLWGDEHRGVQGIKQTMDRLTRAIEGLECQQGKGCRSTDEPGYQGGRP
jgi:hypothetical protein